LNCLLKSNGGKVLIYTLYKLFLYFHWAQAAPTTEATAHYKRVPLQTVVKPA